MRHCEKKNKEEKKEEEEEGGEGRRGGGGGGEAHAVAPIRILAPAVGVYSTRTTARTGRCLLLAAAAGASVMQPVTPGRFRMSEEVEKRVGLLA
eukprot:COSAG02_NODE_57431_length_280_cov_1.337017_1_plen_93_part_11